VGRGVAARRAANGALVDVDDLVDVLEAGDLLMGAYRALAVVEGPGGRGVEDLVHERALARAAHPGDADEQAQREVHGDVLEVVLARSDHGDLAAVALAPFRRRRDLHLALE